VKHFIFVSSIGAMAESSETILTVDTPCAPSTPYGKSKLGAELALKQIAVAGGMAYSIIRPPLVYGSGNPGNMERLLKLVKTGLPLPLASVRNRRSFIYVENLVDLIVTCLVNPKAFGKTFLPSDGEDLSTAELIEKIARANESVPCSVFSDSVGDRETRHTFGRWGDLSSLRSGSRARQSARLFRFPPSLLKAAGWLPGLGALRKLTSSLYVDSEPIQRELDWIPPFTMEEGLRRTLMAPTEKADQ
jgi:nucleoside-diphosphate-sugar epimerase